MGVDLELSEDFRIKGCALTYLSRPVGSCKILGVLMTFVACYSCNLEILGVLNATVFLISENIGSAIAPPAPPLPLALS